MQMCQPRFEKIALIQQPIDTWLVDNNNGWQHVNYRY